MPNHRNVYISLATSMSKTGKFQLTPLVHHLTFFWYDAKFTKPIEISTRDIRHFCFVPIKSPCLMPYAKLNQ